MAAALETAAADAAQQRHVAHGGVAWKLQEQAFGAIDKPELRKLAALAKAAGDLRVSDGVDGAGDAASIGFSNSNNKIPATSPAPTPITLREGNRLVRDWYGTAHTVLVLASGFEWRGQQFGSLSKIAEAITGAHWSGPRFFGLVKRAAENKKVEGKADGSATRDVADMGSNRDQRFADKPIAVADRAL